MVFLLIRFREKYAVILSILVFALLGVLLLTSSAVHATPSKISRKKKEALEIKAQVDKIDQELEEAVEAYNASTIQLHAIQKQIEIKRRELEQLKAELEKSNQILNERLVEIYKRGDTDFLSVLLSTSDYDDFVSRLQFLIRISEKDHEIFESFSASKKRVEETKAKLEEEKGKQTLIQQELVAKKREIESRLEDRKKLLTSIEKEIARLIKEEEEHQARLRREALRRALLARQKSENYATPVSSGVGGKIVEIAKSYLGCPYHWAAPLSDGRCPTGQHAVCFDCSGLTMWCYQKVGIYLLHSAAWQYANMQPVAYEDLEPGDLIFFGRDGVSHVGIYVGDGNFLHAPRTGDVVRIQPLSCRDDFIGAGRP